MIFQVLILYIICPKINFKDSHNSSQWPTESWTFTITIFNTKLIFYQNLNHWLIRIKSSGRGKPELLFIVKRVFAFNRILHNSMVCRLNITYRYTQSGEPWPGGSTSVSRRDMNTQQSRKLLTLSRFVGRLGVRRVGVSSRLNRHSPFIELSFLFSF